eukprot:SAG22_NODE_257_length_13543_cov_26.100417_8_plen_280_part_00
MRRHATGGAAVPLLQLQLGLLVALWPPSAHRPAGTGMLAAAGGGSSGGGAEGGSKIPGGPPADNTTGPADPKPVPCGRGSGVPCGRGGGGDTQTGAPGAAAGSAGASGGGRSRGGAASGRGGGGAADDTGGRSRGGGDDSSTGSGRGGRGGSRGGGASTGGGGRGSPVPQTSPGCSAVQMQMYHQCISNCGGCAASMEPYAMIVAECTIPSGKAAINSMHATCDGHGSSSSSGNSDGDGGSAVRAPPPPPQYVHFSAVGHGLRVVTRCRKMLIRAQLPA